MKKILKLISALLLMTAFVILPQVAQAEYNDDAAASYEKKVDYGGAGALFVAGVVGVGVALLKERLQSLPRQQT